MRISLELAHTKLTPANPPDRWEVDRSCQIGREVRKALEDQGYEVDVALLIDDKQLPLDEGSIGQVETLLAWVAEFTLVDYWASERQLSSYRKELLDLLSSPVTRDARATALDRYVAHHGYLPCSAHIAIWHLLRLGKIRDQHGVLQAAGNGSADAGAPEANLVASILPDYVRHHEDTADRSYLRHIDGRLPERVHRLYFPVTPDFDQAAFGAAQRSFISGLDARGAEIGDETLVAVDEPLVVGHA
jgi:hypothetical protein